MPKPKNRPPRRSVEASSTKADSASVKPAREDAGSTPTEANPASAKPPTEDDVSRFGAKTVSFGRAATLGLSGVSVLVSVAGVGAVFYSRVAVLEEQVKALDERVKKLEDKGADVKPAEPSSPSPGPTFNNNNNNSNSPQIGGASASAAGGSASAAAGSAGASPKPAEINREATAMAVPVATIPVGTIIMFGGGLDPKDVGSKWLKCDGGSVDKARFPELAAVLGNTWSEPGDTFPRLPDLRGVFPRFLSEGAEFDRGRHLGQRQDWATAMPRKNVFAVGEAGEHFHGLDFPMKEAAPGRWFLSASGGTSDPGGRGEPINSTKEAGEHTHTLTGGDTETRPVNQALRAFIRAVP